VETAGLRADIASWRAEVVGWRSEVPATWRDLILSHFEQVHQGVSNLAVGQASLATALSALPRGRARRKPLVAKETLPDDTRGAEEP
jgi:hypothetical protein